MFSDQWFTFMGGVFVGGVIFAPSPLNIAFAALAILSAVMPLRTWRSKRRSWLHERRQKD